jgi:hypothetical protein
MTTLTMRYIEGHIVVTGPDIQPTRFKTRREAKDWCVAHYPARPSKRSVRFTSPRQRGATSGDERAYHVPHLDNPVIPSPAPRDLASANPPPLTARQRKSPAEAGLSLTAHGIPRRITCLRRFCCFVGASGRQAGRSYRCRCPAWHPAVASGRRLVRWWRADFRPGCFAAPPPRSDWQAVAQSPAAASRCCFGASRGCCSGRRRVARRQPHSHSQAIAAWRCRPARSLQAGSDCPALRCGSIHRVR